MIRKYTEEIFEQITSLNKENSLESIPHSDQFIKHLQAMYGIEIHDIRRIITILKESHKIFSIEIVKEDKDKDIKRTEGYVITDIETIRRLKNFFQMLLVEEYENQYKRKLGYASIIKEFYARPGQFKNTPIGQIVNKSIMLEQYENLISKMYYEYTEEWITKKYEEIMASTEETEGPETPKEEKNKEESPNRRAVDSNEYDSFNRDSNELSLNKILQIYGVEFFYRVNLRKYNFELLTKVVEQKVIDRKIDLKILKKMLQKMKTNTHNDTTLLGYIDQIYELDRIVSRHILSSTR